MLNRFTTPERILFAVGLLLATGIPFLMSGNYLPISNHWGSFLGGLGLGLVIAIFIKVARRKKDNLPTP